MTRTLRQFDPHLPRTSTATTLAWHALALTAWLGAIGYDAGAARTTIWPVPWVVVYILAAASAVAASRRSPGVGRTLIGVGGVFLCAVGAILRSAVGPRDIANFGTLQPVDLPLVLALGLPFLNIAVAQRDGRDAAHHDTSLTAVGVGTFLVWWLTLLSEYVARPNLWHGSEFYVVTGAAIPCGLAFTAAAGGRWGATIAAGTYMAILLAAGWLFQALPLAAGNSVLPPPAPLVLVIPAMVVDVISRQIRPRGPQWRRLVLLGAVGAAFVLTMLAVHWPLADWLLRPSIGGRLVGVDRWPYYASPGHWRYEYWTLDPGRRQRVVGLALAVLLSSASAAGGRRLAQWVSSLPSPGTGPTSVSFAQHASQTCNRRQSRRR